MIAIDPMNVKLADLEVLEAQQPKALAISQPLIHERPLLKKRDAKQQILGGLKIINHLSGGDMRQQIDAAEFLSNRVDELEEQLQKERDAFEAEKLGYQKQVKELKHVLRSISTVLDGHVDPFELKPYKKWPKPELGKWIQSAVESMNWARQRADNLLDPQNAVPIAPDPE